MIINECYYYSPRCISLSCSILLAPLHVRRTPCAKVCRFPPRDCCCISVWWMLDPLLGCFTFLLSQPCCLTHPFMSWRTYLLTVLARRKCLRNVPSTTGRDSPASSMMENRLINIHRRSDTIHLRYHRFLFHSLARYGSRYGTSSDVLTAGETCNIKTTIFKAKQNSLYRFYSWAINYAIISTY